MRDFIKHTGERISRRRFIKGGLVATLLLFIAFMFTDFRKTIRRMLRRDTENLNLEGKAISKFIADADREGYWNQFGIAKRVLISAQDTLAIIGIHTPWYGKYLRYRNEITGRFLFSTDLFQPKYFEGKTISYLGFHNPYKAPCGMPFSNLRG
jgi:hypothetical protein